MKIDNFDLIKPHLAFENTGDYHFIQVVRRAKDNVEMNMYMSVIRSFYIFNEYDYEHYKPVIKELCESNNARAYIDINSINVENTKEEAKVILDRYFQYGKSLNDRKWFKKLQYCFDSSSVVIGASNKNGKYSLIDIDEKGIIDNIISSEKYKNVIVFTLPTVNGDHIIVNRSEVVRDFFDTFNLDPADIHDGCYTLLYCNLK